VDSDLDGYRSDEIHYYEKKLYGNNSKRIKISKNNSHNTDDAEKKIKSKSKKGHHFKSNKNVYN